MLAFCKLCHDRRAAIIYWLVNLRFPEYTGYTTTCLLDVGVTISGLWLIFSMMDRECGFRHRFVGRVLYGWHYVDGFPREEIRICKHARSKYGWNGKLEFPVRRHWNFIFNRNKTKYFFFFFLKYSKVLLRIKYFSHNDQSNNVITFKNIFRCYM